VSELPASYWQPFLGDLGDLTPQQLDACRDYLDERNKG
jgi:hypothetical protein